MHLLALATKTTSTSEAVISANLCSVQIQNMFGTTPLSSHRRRRKCFAKERVMHGNWASLNKHLVSCGIWAPWRRQMTQNDSITLLIFILFYCKPRFEAKTCVTVLL